MNADNPLPWACARPLRRPLENLYAGFWVPSPELESTDFYVAVKWTHCVVSPEWIFLATRRFVDCERILGKRPPRMPPPFAHKRLDTNSLCSLYDPPETPRRLPQKKSSHNETQKYPPGREGGNGAASDLKTGAI